MQPPNINSGDYLSANAIKRLALELGADTVGIARAGIVPDKGKYLAWLKAGYAGEMTYLHNHQEERFDPRILHPKARSIIVIGANYCPTAEELARREKPFYVAWYAWGEDYHDILRRNLEKLRARLRLMHAGLRGRICVDTAPFMDKYWAQQAGLGWQGKHTNLVSRQFGSWLVLGSLIIDHEVDRYDLPESDHCGNCSACIRACPTGAIVAPYQLDATRCISYWTIESKAEKFPDEIKRNLNNRVFGCDICLSVCPFNRFRKPHQNAAFKRRSEISLIESGRAADLYETEFNRLFKGSPTTRPGIIGIQRNLREASI
ncbi:MAG: tRNA epoxyqueuosine(34) reductase QueG [candidate division Zixibacteria bacterium]|nr:tRNA epoxyqueuosine(34) reductase QueG [candidate division Zixibacteria bacterium]